MKKYILGIIAELKYLYPSKKISCINGFIGVLEGERLMHTTYLGNAYFEVDGILYTDYNGKSNHKKVIKIS